MKIAILDDYQDAVRKLPFFGRLAGHEVTIFNDTAKGVDALLQRLAPFDAVVLIRERTHIPAALVDRLPKLKLIVQTASIGLHIDIAACTRRGVLICSGVGSGIPTAELTWGLILAAMRHIPLEGNRLRAGQWQTTVGRGLHGRTLGILGLGKIGTLVAKYGLAFGMKVLVWGREGSAKRAAEIGVTRAAGREALFEQSDVLSVHVRLVPATRGTITRADFARMKTDALFVNTSRADLLEHGAIEAALAAGRPGFAALDVFEDEPVLGGANPLFHMDNVVCTPHLGYVEKDNYERYFSVAIDNLLAYAAGKPVNMVNPDAIMETREND